MTQIQKKQGNEENHQLSENKMDFRQNYELQWHPKLMHVEEKAVNLQFQAR